MKGLSNREAKNIELSQAGYSYDQTAKTTGRIMKGPIIAYMALTGNISLYDSNGTIGIGHTGEFPFNQRPVIGQWVHGKWDFLEFKKSLSISGTIAMLFVKGAS